jgi:hypothetical protein
MAGLIREVKDEKVPLIPAAPVPQPEKDEMTPEEREEELRKQYARNIQARGAMAASKVVMPQLVPHETRDLNAMISPAMRAIDKEMDSRRDMAAMAADQDHEKTIVAAKLQNEKDLKAMELDAMLKRLQMEQDAAAGIKRFGGNR